MTESQGTAEEEQVLAERIRAYRERMFNIAKTRATLIFDSLEDAKDEAKRHSEIVELDAILAIADAESIKNMERAKKLREAIQELKKKALDSKMRAYRRGDKEETSTYAGRWYAYDEIDSLLKAALEGESK